MDLLKLLTGQQPVLPKPLHLIHSIEGTSDHVNEKPLELMLALLLELIRNPCVSGNVSYTDNGSKILARSR